jgi:putative (di)nucleoside polyphosphate hydrolase
MIDSRGFRPNVGIIICNRQGQVLWAKRIGQEAWQFPQGGIRSGEKLQRAMYRELKEEVGLEPADVEVLSSTRNWLYYQLPRNFIRQNSNPVCIGQKQKWFLLALRGDESRISLCNDHNTPEFDDWRWVSFWYPLDQVIDFKRDVYRRALTELIRPLNRYVRGTA